jgi:hypothetical protein
MRKQRAYAILTSDSWRIEVNAYDVADAYRKAKAKHPDKKLTPAYMTFGRDGINTAGWISSKSSKQAADKD